MNSWYTIFLMCGVGMAVGSISKYGFERFFRSNHPYQALIVIFLAGGCLGVVFERFLSIAFPETANRPFDIQWAGQVFGVMVSVGIAPAFILSLQRLSLTNRLYGSIPVEMRISILLFGLRSRNIGLLGIVLGAPVVVFGIIYPLRSLVVPVPMLVAGALTACYLVTYLSTPPAVLLLGSSGFGSAYLISIINRGVYPYRCVALLDPVQSEAWRLPSADGVLFNLGNIRILGGHDWKKVVCRLVRMVPFIVVDTRIASPAVVDETLEISEEKFRGKVVLVVQEDGTAPSVEQAGCGQALCGCRTARPDQVVDQLKNLGLSGAS